MLLFGGGGPGTPLKFHVIISSYEIVLADHHLLRKMRWEAIIVDEGHRLKSKSSKLFQVWLSVGVTPSRN